MVNIQKRIEAELPRLRRYARALVRDVADADDLVQDAILRAYRGFDGLRGSNVKAWLLTIVRNCHATSIRQRLRVSTTPLPDEDEAQDGYALVAEGPGPEGATLQADERRSLDLVMQSLPHEYREILILREIEDMDYRQIAQVTGVPMGTVMSRLARARAALKKLWLQQHEDSARAAP